MEVHLTPEMEAKLNEWASATGRDKDDLVQDAMAGYFDELAELRGMIEDRYKSLNSGTAQLIDGDEAFRRLQQMSAERRTGS